MPDISTKTTPLLRFVNNLMKINGIRNRNSGWQFSTGKRINYVIEKCLYLSHRELKQWG
jgi:hypothetical protein